MFRQNFHVIFKEFIEYAFKFVIEAVFHIISFILCWGMNIQNNNILTCLSEGRRYYATHFCRY
jgi:hypothetical protein